MGFISRAWGWLKTMFLGADVQTIFGVEPIESERMADALKLWHDISYNRPPWLDSEDGVESYNIASLIADTRARLITLDIGMAVSGSARAKFLQSAADDLLRRLPEKVSDACRGGGMVIKYNGVGWDYVMPGDFVVTHVDASNRITGAIFAEHLAYNGHRYTRLEYHRFEDGVYKITNKAYRNRWNSTSTMYVLGTPIELTEVDEWRDIEPDTDIANIDTPLFSYFRIPGANLVDPLSPLGCAVFANAIAELKAADISMSRKNTEIEDSKHITFVGQTIVQNASNRKIKLPRFVKGLGMGINDTETSAVHEHVATIQTASRIDDINFDLSLAGIKSGFSAGMFVMNGQRGVLTATQVEADDRVTIQTIKSDRDALQYAIEQAMYGADVLATVMGLAPEGDYDISYSFGDITYSYEEDKANWRLYVQQGWVPVWMYLVRFEGMSEEEAKGIGQEMQMQAMQNMEMQMQMSAAADAMSGGGGQPEE